MKTFGPHIGALIRVPNGTPQSQRGRSGFGPEVTIGRCQRPNMRFK